MLKESFLEYLRFEKNFSDKTVVSYGTDLAKFEEYFKAVDENLDFESVDSDIIRRWILALMDAGYRATSVNRKLSSLRSFYRFLLKRKLVLVDPMQKVQGPKSKKRLPSFVKDSDMQRLLDNTCFGEGFEGIRDYVIVEVFYMTGMRLSEMVGLKDEDVDLLSQTIKVTGKRNKQRLIPFGEQLKSDLLAYISAKKEYQVAGERAFFIRKSGERMYPRLIYLLVKRNLAKVVTLKKKSPHVLRHTFATSMLNHEANLEAVKELLGHERLTTTEIYTHMTFEELKKVYEHAHPRA